MIAYHRRSRTSSPGAIPGSVRVRLRLRVIRIEARCQVDRGINQGRKQPGFLPCFKRLAPVFCHVIFSVINPHIKHANSLAIAVAATFLFMLFFNASSDRIFFLTVHLPYLRMRLLPECYLLACVLSLPIYEQPHLLYNFGLIQLKAS